MWYYLYIVSITWYITQPLGRLLLRITNLQLVWYHLHRFELHNDPIQFLLRMFSLQSEYISPYSISTLTPCLYLSSYMSPTVNTPIMLICVVLGRVNIWSCLACCRLGTWWGRWRVHGRWCRKAQKHPSWILAMQGYSWWGKFSYLRFSCKVIISTVAFCSYHVPEDGQSRGYVRIENVL